MALSAELLRRLDHEEEPLSKRLCWAATAFESCDLPVQRKEELVLGWLCSFQSKDEISKDVWILLRKCLSSQHMNNLQIADIKPAIKHSVIEMVCNHVRSDNIPKDLHCILLQCAVTILESPYFQQSLKNNLEGYFSLVLSFLDTVNTVEHVPFYAKVISSISDMHKQTAQVNDFKVIFVQRILTPMFQALGRLDSQLLESTYSNPVGMSVVKCIQQVIFPNSNNKGITVFLNSLFVETSETVDEFLELMFKHLSKTKRTLAPEVAHCIQSAVFQAFVRSFRNDRNGDSAIHQMVVVFCYLNGFHPKVKHGDKASFLLKSKVIKKIFHEKKIVTEGTELSLNIIESMLTFLTNSNVQIGSKINGIYYHEWLRSLLMLVFEEMLNQTLTVAYLKFLIALINYDPLIIEPILLEVLVPIMLSSKEHSELRKAYCTLLSHILDMNVKLSSLDKIVEKLLANFSSLNGKQEVSVDLLDVLPLESCLEFSCRVARLPSKLIWNMMKAFIFHLTSWLKMIETQQLDAGSKLYLQILIQLLCLFLKSVKMADNTVPTLVTAKFQVLMTDLGHTLAKFAVSMLNREHDSAVMVTFLNASHTWGELHILQLHYGIKCEPPTVQTDTCATNFAGLHWYLNNDQWNLIAQRISNFGQAECKDILNKLTIQKMLSLTLFGGRCDQASCAEASGYIVDNIKDTWPVFLGDNAAILMPVLAMDQVLHVAAYIAQEITSSQDVYEHWLPVLHKPVVQENRPLVLSLLGTSLSGIGKLFTRRKRSSTTTVPDHIAKGVLPLINPELFLKAQKKPKVLEPLMAELSVLVNSALEKQDDLSDSKIKLDLETLEKQLAIVNSLPLPFLSKNIQIVMVLSSIAIANHLKLIRTHQKMNMHKLIAIKKILLEHIILGMLDNVSPVNLSGHLNLGLFTRWYTTLDFKLHHKEEMILFSQLFMSCIKHGVGLHNLEILVDTLDLKQEIQHDDFKLTVILLKALTLRKRIHLDEETRSVCARLQKRLSRGIISALKHGAIDPATALEGYMLILQSRLKQNPKKLSNITSHCHTFLQVALSGLGEHESSQGAQDNIDFIFTLLKNRKELGDCISEDLMLKVWTLLETAKKPVLNIERMNLLLDATTNEEYATIFQSLLTKTTGAAIDNNSPALSLTVTLWTNIASCTLSTAKNVVRDETLSQVCSILRRLIHFWQDTESMPSEIIPILELELAFVLNKQTTLISSMLDMCLESIALQNKSSDLDFPALWSARFKVIHKLLDNRGILLLNRLPALLQCYRHLISTLAARSDVANNLTPCQIETMAMCALDVDKLTTAMKKHKKDFARVSPYLVADVINELGQWSLYPEVKLHYLNVLYALLAMCDTHAIQYLLRSLAPASRHIFDSIYSDYNKYHSYKGKI